jgi:hypothetical protein
MIALLFLLTLVSLSASPIQQIRLQTTGNAILPRFPCLSISNNQQAVKYSWTATELGSRETYDTITTASTHCEIDRNGAPEPVFNFNGTPYFYELTAIDTKDTAAPSGSVLKQMYKYEASISRFGEAKFTVYWQADGSFSIVGLV